MNKDQHLEVIREFRRLLGPPGPVFPPSTWKEGGVKIEIVDTPETLDVDSLGVWCQPITKEVK